PTEKIFEATMAMPPPEGSPAQIQITRKRGTARKKETAEEKPRQKQKKQLPQPPSKLEKLTSFLSSFSKSTKQIPLNEAEKEDAVDEQVLSEVFSKFGIETKIDKIEAEFDAEAKATRDATTRSKSETKSTDSFSPKPEPVHFDYGHLGAHPHTRQWAVAATLFGTLLTVQLLFLGRDSIARELPFTRPAFVSLCETFGCTMPLSRDEELILVEDYGLLLQPTGANQYVFYATVTNKARYFQDWPTLELDVLDETRKPLAQRTFSPEEWVPNGQLTPNGIAPRASISMRMNLEVLDVIPSNYKLGHFYP
ncbi:MAG: DUF3426 domain-containing protein, partial [Azoarcus sp.]|nr:DUF3426 domain-containing protein [Azoarcus sp.]